MLSRRRIIYILVFIVATLLVINVLLNYTKKKQSVIVKESINRIEVETIFNRTISNYGIDSSWIKKSRLKKGDYDSINYKYLINLPFLMLQLKIVVFKS